MASVFAIKIDPRTFHDKSWDPGASSLGKNDNNARDLGKKNQDHATADIENNLWAAHDVDTRYALPQRNHDNDAIDEVRSDNGQNIQNILECRLGKAERCGYFAEQKSPHVKTPEIVGHCVDASEQALLKRPFHSEREICA